MIDNQPVEMPGATPPSLDPSKVNQSGEAPSGDAQSSVPPLSGSQQPGDASSSTNQPSGNQPGNTSSSVGQAGGDKSGAASSNSLQGGNLPTEPPSNSNQSTGNQPSDIPTSANQPGGDQPSVQSSGSQAGSSQPSGAPSNATPSDDNQPVNRQPNDAAPNTIPPNDNQSASTQPGDVQPAAAPSNDNQSASNQSNEATSDAGQASAAQSVSLPELSCYDFVIVGSGVAGALLAKELAHAGFSVCILEAGGSVERGEAVTRYRESMVRDLAAPYPRWPWAPIPDPGNPEAYFGNNSSSGYRPSYLKQVGGTTWHWTGMTPRFLPADFELNRRYGVGVDWPFGYAELEPYYLKAEHALGVSGDSADDHGSPRSGDYPMPPIPMPYSDRLVAEALAKHGIPVKPFPAARNSQPYHDRPQCCGNNTCTPICPIGAQYSANTDIDNAIRLGARLMRQATVYRFELNDEKHIVAAHYKLPDGSSQRIEAKRFVVACNSIETPRLLLMAACEQAPDGIANSSGQVGRNLMDHLIFFNTFRMNVPLYGGRGPQSVSGVMTGRDGEFRRMHSAVKLFLSNDLNIQEKALQAIDDKQHWSNVVNAMRQAAIHQGCIGGELEPLPSEQNRVTLDKERLDPLGLPLPQVSYRVGNYVNDGLGVWKKLVGDLLGKIGAESVAFSVAHSSHHPSGTARMGNNRMNSVVDRNCRSHDHPNLYVVGGSVFPTMGTANPTLTIAALSLRLAEHLTKIAAATPATTTSATTPRT